MIPPVIADMGAREIWLTTPFCFAAVHALLAAPKSHQAE